LSQLCLNEFWAFVFFPLILWSSFKLIKTGKQKYLVLLGLFLALLFTTHMLMTMIFLPVFGVFCLFYLIQSKNRTAYLQVLFGIFLGVGLAAFYLLPLFFERKYAHFETLLMGYFDYRQHFVNLKDLFFSMEWGYGSSGFPAELLNLSVGIIQWVVGLVVVLYLAFKNIKTKPTTALLALLIFGMALFSIFMIHMRSSFIWSMLPPLIYLQFPWRFLSISTLLLALLVGIAVKLSSKGYILGIALVIVSMLTYSGFFVAKEWYQIGDSEKFSGASWDKQQTISIFDYLPIYATLPPWQRAPQLPEVLEGSADFVSYDKFSKSQRGVVAVSQNALLRAPIFDFPGMTVYVDGQVVKHLNNDCRDQRYCLGLVTFEVAKGTHSIEIILEDTPPRTIGNLISVVSLLFVLYLLYMSYVQKSIK